MMLSKSFLSIGAAIVMSSATVAIAQDDEAPLLSPQQIIENAPDDAWRSVDPSNLIYMDLPAGTVIIEMRPDIAPGHVERVSALTREGFYNGLSFHRVIEGFMAQGGDPKGDGTGGSDKPDIPGEFTRDSSKVDNFVEIGRDRIAPRVGYIDGMPVAAQPESLRTFVTASRVDMWPVHCPGVMSMARATDPNSANSQFFLMIGDSRLNLDRRYTAWGWIIDGFEATRRIARGEPPARPTPIMRMRIADELPAEDRRQIEVLRTDSEVFMQYLKRRGDVDETGYVKDICDIRVPVRINGKIER